MGQYDGVHSFLFVHWEEDPAAVIEDIRRRLTYDPVNGPLHFSAVLEEGSAFGGFAHISAATAEEVGTLIATELWEAGVRSDYETEGRFYRRGGVEPMGPKRGSPRFAALCRTRVERRPLDVMERIAERWGAEAPFVGASQLLRRSRLLVELGDDDRGALDEHIAALRDVEGVSEVTVGIADSGSSAA